MSVNNIPNLYALFGIDATASDADIKGAFRRAASSSHPDVNRTKIASTLFRCIDEARSILQDSSARAEYDRQRGLPPKIDRSATFTIGDTWATLWGCEVTAVTEKAFLIRLPDETERWFPRSMVGESCKRWAVGSRGEFKVKSWFVEKDLE